MNDFSNIAEFSAKKKQSAAFKVARVAVPLTSAILAVLISDIITGMYGLIWGILSLVLLIGSSLTYSLISFRTVEYDYRIVGSEISFSAVFNGKRRRELASVDISRLEAIAPYEGKHREDAERTEYDNICDYSSSPADPNVYYAVERDDEDGTRTLYLFNASEKMLKLMKLYNRKTVIK